MSIAAIVEVLENAILTGPFWGSATDGSSNAISRNPPFFVQRRTISSDNGMENCPAYYSTLSSPDKSRYRTCGFRIGFHFTGYGVYRALPSKVDLSESVDELGDCPILFARL